MIPFTIRDKDTESLMPFIGVFVIANLYFSFDRKGNEHVTSAA
jgi:hypothetical protein